MNLKAALTEWTGLLGTGGVASDTQTLDHYARSTMPKGTRPAAVLYPQTTQDCAALVRIAAGHHCPLYPLSRGKNWGYGDACAVSDGQVIVDLKKMNRIIEVNEELAYAVIEAGVTQGQLSDYLLNNHPGLILDVTGAGPDASIVGNTLERGFGHTPYGDHFTMSAGYEVVLPDGNVITTGFGHHDHAKTTYCYKAGIGPSLDGLFTQSNFGIITKMGVFLLSRPAHVLAFAIILKDNNTLSRCVDALRPLRHAGLLQSAIHIGNDLRAMSARGHYPWDQLQGQTPLPKNLRETLIKKMSLGAWNVVGAIYGTKGTNRGVKRELKKAMRGIARVKFFDEALLKTGIKILGVTRRLGFGAKLLEMANAVSPVFDLLMGRPSPKHLSGAGWRSRRETLKDNPDPLDNNWGFLWVSPVVPMTGDHALRILKIVEPVFEKYRFEPLITMTAITARALDCVMTVAYDRENPAESQSALTCYDELFAAILREGYPPYRCGIRSMSKIFADKSPYAVFLQTIKTSIDPQGIISPGRYVPL
ncbi:MAG: FAD-binding oxidoreductase [Deltaproteobacteria bacterium]|nr:FAD-binding oxidoreductase [Deltaproteobacteria bacterium]